MAVNLLLIANQMRGNLHNSPSGSRTRSSDANEPGNLPSSGSIPGTNINQDEGIRSVARKGRRGDSELRRVGGEVAHVNTTEANAIDTLGPMGEAWVQSIGSGTINPQTGKPEYWPKFLTPPKSVRNAVQGGLDWVQDQVPGAQTIADRWDQGIGPVAGIAKNIKNGTTWKPSEGKWGIFGQTGASKERDQAKIDAKARRTQFEDYRREYEDENIAGIFTESEEDNTDLTGEYVGSPGFNDMITTKSGLEPETNDIADYLDEYDPTTEGEIDATLGRDLELAKVATKKLVAKRQGTGDALSSGMFGLLTQSADTTSQKNFAGAGDFEADFKKKTAIKAAEADFGGTDLEEKELGINVAETMANAATATENLHEDYNQEFWENMMTWDTAINS